MGQLPRYHWLVARQLAVLQHVLGLVVPALQQLLDGLEFLGFNIVDEFLPGQLQPGLEATEPDADFRKFVFQMGQAHGVLPITSS